MGSMHPWAGMSHLLPARSLTNTLPAYQANGGYLFYFIRQLTLRASFTTLSYAPFRKCFSLIMKWSDTIPIF